MSHHISLLIAHYLNFFGREIILVHAISLQNDCTRITFLFSLKIRRPSEDEGLFVFRRTF